MGARFLDDEARAAFKQAIEAVENASAVEVVVAVRRRSHRYLHANVVVGAVLAFVGLAVMLFAEHTFPLTSILVDPFVVALLGGAVVELTPAIKRLLTTPAARRTHVDRAAGVAHWRGTLSTHARPRRLAIVEALPLLPNGKIDRRAAAALPTEPAE